jgi:hypothetical protein
MTPRQAFWNAFRNFAIVFSFAINLILVIALLTASLPGLRLALGLKGKVVEPLLGDLDSAFLALGKATIDTSVEIDEPIPIQFNLPLDQRMPIEFNLPLDQPLPINFQLSIDQDTNVVLRQAVPLDGLPATFNLPGGGGMIKGNVSLYLPAGLNLPVHLSMTVPVSKTIPVRMNVPVKESIPVRMNVPVKETIPIKMTVPVHIVLGEAGLGPAVEQLRAVFRPLREQLEAIPNDLPFLK